VIEHFPDMHKALGSIPSAVKKKKKRSPSWKSEDISKHPLKEIWVPGESWPRIDGSRAAAGETVWVSLPQAKKQLV
jgi:hypothetical protein